MSPHLDESLCKKYPLIFANRHGSVMETLMCWGFDCGDGWYDLIDTLCGEIQHHIDNRKRNREVILKKETFDSNTLPEEIPQVVAVQVKEKFGSLRFYYDLWALSIRPYIFSYIHFKNPYHVLNNMAIYIADKLKTLTKDELS